MRLKYEPLTGKAPGRLYPDDLEEEGKKSRATNRSWPLRNALHKAGMSAGLAGALAALIYTIYS